MPKGVYKRDKNWGSWNKGRTDLGGETDPRWKRVKQECLICHNLYWIKRSHAHLRKTCSRNCHKKYRSLYLAGENAPSWRGGISKRAKYKNTFKKELKQKIKERDKVCQVCGSLASLQVHYIDFNPVNSTEENLILLCASCHSTIERIRYHRVKRGVKNNLSKVYHQKILELAIRD